MNSNLRVKELERQNETLQAEVYQKVNIYIFIEKDYSFF
jgi:hypothetical protein